jgi:hypothetical protein
MSRYIFDAETDITLRNAADGAETATASEAGVAFNPALYEQVAVVFNVASLDATTGDESYVLSVETDTAATPTAAVQQAALPNVRAAGAGRYVVILDCATMLKLDPDASYIRVKGTLGGTTPGAVYGAYLHPVKGAGRP